MGAAAGPAPRDASEIIPISSDVSFVDSLLAPPTTGTVQRDSGGAAGDADVHALAAHGTAGSAAALPFLDQIQASFGAHDISGVRAHTGADAAAAARGMGATAFATGDHVAFAGAPDLHTTAHEAAHVIQQRGGVQLQGGVGAADDRHEQHADEVADAVVRGESAAHLLGAYGGAEGAAPVQRQAVQRFEEPEHRDIGNKGTDSAMVSLDGNMPLEFGDMVAMAGDYFGSLDEMKALARKPGPGEGTREELEYVRTVKVRGEKDKEESFSQEARAAVDRRFYRLAGKNLVHFPNAAVGDAEKRPEDRARDGIRFPMGVKGDVDRIVQSVLDDTGGRDALPGIRRDLITPELRNAAAGYRYYHVRALVEAAVAGQWNAHMNDVRSGLQSKDEREQGGRRDLSESMATEAFGDHFLTDMFSAGHVRTERGSIQEYWNTKVPMFFYNLKGFMAEEIVRGLRVSVEVAGMVEFDVGDAMEFDPPMIEGAMDKVNASLNAIGELGFGDVISGVVHDHDSHHGVQVTANGADGELFGDGRLSDGDEEQFAIRAVALSFQEVQKAFELGAGNQPAESVPRTFLRNGVFAAEQLIPKPKANHAQKPDQQKLDWQRPDAASLLTAPEFAEPLKRFCNAKAGQIDSVGKALDPLYLSILRTRVTEPLRARPVQTMQTVIDWVPSISTTQTTEYTRAARKTPGGMSSLTMRQRQKLIAAHLKAGEGKDLAELLRSAPDGDRNALIEQFGRDQLRPLMHGRDEWWFETAASPGKDGP